MAMAELIILWRQVSQICKRVSDMGISVDSKVNMLTDGEFVLYSEPWNWCFVSTAAGPMDRTIFTRS